MCLFASAKREVYFSELYLKAPGAAAALVWNPAITATGCCMLLAMFLALPFALQWPKRASWLQNTSLGRVCLLLYACCLLPARTLQHAVF